MCLTLSGKNAILPNWEEKDWLRDMIMDEGTHGMLVTVRALQDPYHHLIKFGSWYKTRDTVLSENPYTNFLLTKKKWPLNEQFVLHSLYFNQVTLLL